MMMMMMMMMESIYRLVRCCGKYNAGAIANGGRNYGGYWQRMEVEGTCGMQCMTCVFIYE